MTRINVIDLDKTLIPYDSFRLLVKKQLFRGDFYIAFLLVLRMVRVIDSVKFKNLFISQLKKRTLFEKQMESYASTLVKSIDPKILKLVQENTVEGTLNVILSASPNEYVIKVAENIGFLGFGSSLENNIYIDLKGINKIRKLKDLFPPHQFDYNFAISDSEEDKDLLSLFAKHVLLTG